MPDTTRVCLDISCNVVSPLLCAISLSSRSHLTATCSCWDVSDQCLCMSLELPAALDFSLFCSYIVRANEKQAVFTGKQQRDGVAILAFFVAGLFGPVGHEDAGGAFAAEHEAEPMAAAASTNATGYKADGDNEAAKVGRNFVIDWAAYHNVWGDTPVDVAVTAMFAEYAVLYSRIAGRTTSAVPPPMTMSEGLAIDEQAQNFVNKFVTPILGHIASVKVHKLLCHVTDAIRWHGNLQNGNTAVKESEHKSDKPFYARTSQNAHTFTRQIVRHAHGSRAILARHAKDDEVSAATWKAELARRAAVASAAVIGGAARPLDSGAAAAAGRLAMARIEAPAAGRAAVMCRQPKRSGGGSSGSGCTTPPRLRSANWPVAPTWPTSGRCSKWRLTAKGESQPARRYRHSSITEPACRSSCARSRYTSGPRGTTPSYTGPEVTRRNSALASSVPSYGDLPAMRSSWPRWRTWRRSRSALLSSVGVCA